MKKLILLTILALSVLRGFAEKQNIAFRHLTTEDGLSQFSVNYLYVDEWGTLWIGTREGLNRYNGNDIKTYKLEKNNPNSLFCNTVLRIVGNQNGKVYLLCTEGVAEFDMLTQKFTTLLQGNITSIHFHDKLYIGNKDEIFVFNENTRNFDFVYRLPGNDISISSLHSDHNGNLWMGTSNSGVYVLSDKKELSHPIDKANITNIFEDSEEGLWIGSWEHGLYHIKPNGEIENLRHDASNPNSISSDFVRSCNEDNLGNIWIGTFNGLNRYQKSTGKFDLYEANTSKGSLTHPSIWSIVKDAQGTLWMGTYFGGVNYFNPEYEIYNRYEVSEEEGEGLSSPIVGRMVEDKSGKLWIGTEGGGLNIYDKKTGKYRWILDKNTQNSLSRNNVKAIYYNEGDDIMWVGTHMGGLNRIDLKTGLFKRYKMKEGDDSTLPSDIVRDIAPYGNDLIVATQNGVALFDTNSEECTQLFKETKEGKSIKMVADVLVDKDGMLWVAATGEGVFAYDFNTKQLTNYRHDVKNANSLSNNNVNNIEQDKQGNIWFSTSGSGLDRFNKQTGQFINYDMANSGLSSDCVYEVCESSLNPNHLLLITNQGFFIFDKSTGSFRNFSTENGFPLSAVNENALYVSPEGKIYLGGIQGMISFNEKDLHFTPKPYKVTLSRLIVNNQEIAPGDSTGILTADLCYTSEITLKAKQNMFSIDFATSNHIPANRDHIRYRLEGFSTTWNTVERGQSTITYTNLNPGHYTLTIKAGLEGAEEVQLKIRVLPPWYRTWWAYIIYITLTMSLIVYLIRAYKSRIRLRESLRYEQKHIEDLEALNQSKLRFFTNISHEFRTPLTLIVGQVETLLQLQTFTPAVYNKVLGIYKSSLQLRELITELLDFRKQEQGHMKIRVSQHNIVNFLYENYLIFREYTNTKKIDFIFDKGAEDIEVWYDQKQLQKVINNLLSNALKHTKEEDTITLSVKKEGEKAVIRVKDTGTGIDASEIDKIFDRFYQTEQLNSLSTGAGTGIGLALTKGIIELHHGDIRVESELGKGTTFIITLQLGKEHFNADQISLHEDSIKQIEAPATNVELMAEAALDNEIPMPQPSDAKILIVEDDAAIRNMLADVFKTFYQVLTATDGVEALEIIEKEMPNIVLSDVVMPRMSGTELCKKIKGEFNTCHIPVVLLTARTAVEHTIEGLKLGADDYITKPFNMSILVSRCNNLVNSRIQLQEKFSKQPQAFAQILATNAMDKEMLDRAMKIIERHLDDTEFNVNVFAREMGMARTNLFTKLKAVTGQTPNDFILTIRLKKGAIMLRSNPELNIAEISDRIGFSSSRYFSKCFKDIYQVSPMSYRKGEDQKGNNEEEEDDSSDIDSVSS